MSRTSKAKARIFGSGGIAEKWDPFLVRSTNGRIVDFSFMRARGKLGESVVRTLTAKQVALASHMKSRSFARFFFEVLDERCEAAGIQPPTSQEEIDLNLATSIIEAIKHHPDRTAGDRADNWSKAYTLLQKLTNNRLPTRRRHARATKRRRGWKTYSDEDVETLVREARLCIDELLVRQAEIAALREKYRTWDFRVRPSNKEELIAFWIIELGAVPLTAIALRKMGYSWFVWALQTRGLNLFKLHRHVHPSAEDAIPFIILLEHIFGLNQRGVLDLELDCIGVVDGRPSVRNNKPRSGGVQFTPEVSTEAFEEAKWLINTFIEISAAARLLATTEEKCRVWVVVQRNGRFGRLARANSFIRAMEYDNSGASTFYLGLERWAKERGLPAGIIGALNHRMRKHSIRIAYNDVAGNDQESQHAGVKAARLQVNDRDGLLGCYALNLVPEVGAIRVFSAIESILMQQLHSYGIN
jgi:nitrate reductase NapE component